MGEGGGKRDFPQSYRIFFVAMASSPWIFVDASWTAQSADEQEEVVCSQELRQCLLVVTPLPEVLVDLIHEYMMWCSRERLEPRNTDMSVAVISGVFGPLGDPLGPIYFDARDWLGQPFAHKIPAWRHPLHLPTPQFDHVCQYQDISPQPYAVLLAMLGALLEPVDAPNGALPFAPLLPLIFGQPTTGKTVLLRALLRALQPIDVCVINPHDDGASFQHELVRSRPRAWAMFEFGRRVHGRGMTSYLQRRLGAMARGDVIEPIRKRVRDGKQPRAAHKLPGCLMATTHDLGPHVASHAPHLVCFVMNKRPISLNTSFDELLKAELPALVRKCILTKQYLQHYLREQRLTFAQFVERIPYFAHTKAAYVAACSR
jgi:hypothetical protein